SSDLMDEAERLCDRLVIVDHGQVIAEGTPTDLIERLGGHHVVEFALAGNGHGDTSAWQSLPRLESVRSEDGLIRLNVPTETPLGKDAHAEVSPCPFPANANSTT